MEVIRPLVVGISIACGVALGTGFAAQGGEPNRELREYGVWVDSAAAGTYELAISTAADGGVSVTSKADIKITYFKLYTYTYSLMAKESWVDGQLRTLRSSSDDNGKKFRVQAEFREGEGSVTVNDKQRKSEPAKWATSFWQLPPAEQLDGEFLLLDADTGEPLRAKVTRPKLDSVEIGGTPRDCLHIRVTQPRVIDLWFDGKRRLVRQVSTEDGHPTELRIKSIRTEAR